MKRLLFVAFVFIFTACGGGGNVAPPRSNSGGTPIGPAGANFGSAIAAHYTLTDLGPNAGQPWITPTRVNNSGVVVMNSSASPLGSLPCTTCGNTPPQGLVFQNGTVRALPPLAGDTESIGTDVNNAGDIVGGSTSATTPETAVMWKPDLSIVTLGTGIAAPDSSAEAEAISDSGIIAGYSFNATSIFPTFFDGKGGATDPCGSGVQGYFRSGVNDAGVAVGDELLSAGGTAAMICPPFTAIATPSDPSWLNFGFDINNAGVAVGRLTVGSRPVFHPFVYQNGKLTDLGTLFPNTPSSVGAAFGINNSGMIVGWSAQSGGTIGNPPVPPVNPRAWVYANGKMVDLNTLLPASCANWTLIVANGVSDNGDIVGVAFVGGYPNGDEHAFLLTPHP
jgi:probable HAF family extracellular repeat protein